MVVLKKKKNHRLDGINTINDWGQQAFPSTKKKKKTVPQSK